MNGHGWMTHGVVSGCDCVVIVTWLISCKYSSEGVSQPQFSQHSFQARARFLSGLTSSLVHKRLTQIYIYS